VSAEDYTREFAVVQAAERAAVQARRKQRGAAPDEPSFGLSLSNGGIRSAAFALGTLQALQARGLYHKLDYVSGVSGGGYAGAALAWLTRRPAASFPFNPEGDAARFLRERADYLNPRTAGISFFSLLGQVVTQAAMSLLVYGSLLTGSFFLLMIADTIFDLFKPALHTASRADWWYSAVEGTNSALAFGLLCIGATLAWRLTTRGLYWLGRSLVRPPPADVTAAYHHGLQRQRLLGRMFVTINAALVLGSVPLVAHGLAGFVQDEMLRALLLSLLLGAALGLQVRAFGATRSRRKSRSPTSGMSNAMKVLVAALTLYTLLLASHAIAHVITDSGVVWSIFVVVGIAVVASFALNLNVLGPARVYRDRLIEAFLPDADAIARGVWQPASEAAAFALVDLASEQSAAPFALINCHLIAPRSPIASCRDRGGDSFLLSPLYSGSHATGWRKTASWPRRRPMTLGTAMAISGAGLTPDAADGGHGATRGRLISAVMALFNLRLAHWIDNPDPRIGRRARGVPSVFAPGLRQGVLGLGLSEQEPWVQLSDGGHFDALGLYELVRRQLDLIIVSDASPGSGFESLGRVTQRVRSDFGAEIRLEIGASFTEHGYASGSIHYPSGQQATLIYLKTVLTPELPIDVRSYAQEHPAFPQTAASDYWCDENEFEAYRTLGYTIAGNATARLELGAAQTAARESYWRELRPGATKDQASGQASGQSSGKSGQSSGK
jgi:hypothetical protein